MPNVDKCVRECEAGLCGNNRKSAQSINNIKNNERVLVLRNKPTDWIYEFLKNGQKVIKSKIKQDFYTNSDITTESITLLPSSNNNKLGADLLHILPNGESIDIEVKFGEETNKNIGQEVFSKIFGTNCFAEELSVISRRQMLNTFLEQNQDEGQQLNRLFAKINKAIKVFNKHIELQDSTLTSDQQKYMEQEIINNSGNSLKNYKDYYLKFTLTGINFSDTKQIQTGKGYWIVQKAKTLNEDTRRANIFVFNPETNTRIKYTLNWKNNYKSKSVKFPAKLGFGSSSWNVWISVEVTKLP